MKNSKKTISIIAILLIAMTLIVGCNQKEEKFDTFAQYEDSIDKRASEIIAEEFNIDVNLQELREIVDEANPEDGDPLIGEIKAIIGDNNYYNSMTLNYVLTEAQKIILENNKEFDDEEITKAIEDNEKLLETIGLIDEDVERQEEFMKEFLVAKEFQKMRLEAYSKAHIQVLEKVNPEYLKELKLNEDPEVLDEYVNNQVFKSIMSQLMNQLN